MYTTLYSARNVASQERASPFRWLLKKRTEDRFDVRLPKRCECFVPLIWEEVETLFGRHNQCCHSSHYANRLDEGRGAHLDTTFYHLFSRPKSVADIYTIFLPIRPNFGLLPFLKLNTKNSIQHSTNQR